MAKHVRIIFLLALGGLLSSCDKGIINEKFAETGSPWDAKKPVKLNLAAPSEAVEVDLVLKHSTSYPYANIRYFVNLKVDGKLLRRDTLNYILAESSGIWLGEGSSSSRTIYLNYLPTLSPVKGKNIELDIYHAMRTPALPGTEKLGVIFARKQK